MVRYFFNIRTGGEVVPDLEGAEYPDIPAAKVEAEKAARDILAETLKKGDVVDGQVFEVMDKDGKLAFVYPFRNALRLP